MTTLSIIAHGSRVKTSRCKGRVQRQILQPRITFSSLEIHWHVRWQTGKHRVSSNCYQNTISASLTYKSVEMQRSINQKNRLTYIHKAPCFLSRLAAPSLGLMAPRHWNPKPQTHTHSDKWDLNCIKTSWSYRMVQSPCFYRWCVWERDNSEQHTDSQTLLTGEDKTEHVTADNSYVSFCTFNLVFQ